MKTLTKPILNRKYSLITAWAIFTLILIVFTCKLFSDSYGFRNPITRSLIYSKVQIITPLQKTTHKAPQALKIGIQKVYAAETEQAYINSKLNSKLLNGIWALESSRGVHDGCRDKGLWNGFGYSQSTSVWNCFPDYKTVVDKVDSWITSHKDLTDAQLLCYYNSGYIQTWCQYYQNYINL